MTNKYKKALDELYECSQAGRFLIYGNEEIDKVDKATEELQELIDNYIELVNDKCKKCGDFNIITKMEPLTILCKEKGCKWYGK